MYPLCALCKTSASDELVKPCAARSEPAKAAEPRHMMPRPSPCSGKLHFDAYSMVKLVACGVDGNVQSSLPMPRRSRHAAS